MENPRNDPSLNGSPPDMIGEVELDGKKNRDYVPWRRWCFFNLLYKVREVMPNVCAA